jgi:hypothetical protein
MRECNRKRISGAAVLRVVAFLLATTAGGAFAQAGEIFAGLDGVWSGEGSAKFSDGSTTPLRCHGSYAVSGGGDHLDQSLDCASPRQTFAFRIALDQTNGAILGAWQELTRQVQGGVTGAGVPGKYELVVRGQGFSAQASVLTRAARQSVAITGGGGGFSGATIVLRRGR